MNNPNLIKALAMKAMPPEKDALPVREGVHTEMVGPEGKQKEPAPPKPPSHTVRPETSRVQECFARLDKQLSDYGRLDARIKSDKLAIEQRQAQMVKDLAYLDAELKKAGDAINQTRVQIKVEMSKVDAGLLSQK